MISVMKKSIALAFVTLIMFLGQLVTPNRIFAVSCQLDSDCPTYPNATCVNGLCGADDRGFDTSDDVFGTISPPAGVAQYDAAGGEQGGLILFLSNIIRIGTVVAGVWVMVNFILAGWTFITSGGEAKAYTEASQKITFSIIGIVVIVAAYTLAAIVGLVVFGDATYILNPRFTGIGVGGPP